MIFAFSLHYSATEMRLISDCRPIPSALFPFALLVAVLLVVAPTPSDSLVIYRRKPKPKLICHEEEPSHGNASSNNGPINMSSNDGLNDSESTASLPASMVHKKTGANSGDFYLANAHIKQHHPIVLKTVRRKKEVRSTDTGLDLSASVGSGEKVAKTNASELLGGRTSTQGEDDEEFEIVSDDLSDEEKIAVRKKLVQTCRALNLSDSNNNQTTTP